MNAMLIGADDPGNIPAVLSGLEIRIAQRVSGRLAAHQHRLPCVPKNIELLIMFTDFIGRNVMRSCHCQGQAQGIPVIVSRRSASCLISSLQRYLAHKTSHA